MHWKWHTRCRDDRVQSMIRCADFISVGLQSVNPLVNASSRLWCDACPRHITSYDENRAWACACACVWVSEHARPYWMNGAGSHPYMCSGPTSIAAHRRVRVCTLYVLSRPPHTNETKSNSPCYAIFISLTCTLWTWCRRKTEYHDMDKWTRAQGFNLLFFFFILCRYFEMSFFFHFNCALAKLENNSLTEMNIQTCAFRWMRVCAQTQRVEDSRWCRQILFFRRSVDQGVYKQSRYHAKRQHVCEHIWAIFFIGSHGRVISVKGMWKRCKHSIPSTFYMFAAWVLA